MRYARPSRSASALVVGLSVLFVAGCAERGKWEAGPAPAPNSVVILDTGPDRIQEDAESILRAAFPDARRLRVEQLTPAGPHLRQERAVLIVPALHTLEEPHWQQIAHHIRRGGPVLFWGTDPAAGEAAPSLAMLRPWSEYYSSHAREIIGFSGGLTESSRPIPFQSPFPRVSSSGATDLFCRWIPLAEAREPGGHACGWPASLWIEAPAEGPLRAWGWIGWAPSSAHAAVQRALLRRAARGLLEEHRILAAGIGRAAVGPGEPLELALRIATTAPTAGPWRIAVEMENSAGIVTRRLSASINPPDTRRPISIVSTSLFIGMAPRAIARAEDALLRIALSDAAGAKIHDELTQRIRLLPADEQAGDEPADERIGVRGADFIVGRRPLRLFGVAFSPVVAGRPGNPLDIERYEISRALRELDLFREGGFNLVEIDYTDLAQAPQLRHLLDEMRPRHLWALLKMPALSPWTPDWARAKAQLSALRLPTTHRIFAIAIDLALDPRDEAAQRALRAAWRAWIDEQYGDAARAERLLGASPDSVQPSPESARDESTPAPMRRAIARFFSDHASRHARDVRHFLQTHAPGALLTAVGGDDYPLPVPAHHLDFVTCTLPETATPPETGLLELRTAHARGAAGGKPVLWRLAGVSVASPSSPDELRRQADVLAAIGRSLHRARAAGLLYAALASGPRSPENTDIGLVHPDTRWRPGGDALRGRLHEWRRAPAQTPVWRGREAEPEFDAARRSWGNRYAAESQADLVEELRPTGWGHRTRDLPPVGLNHHAIDPPEPLLYVNAEWIEPRPDAQPLRHRARQPISLECLNAGVAVWSPSVTGHIGAVWVRAQSKSGRTHLLPVRETAPGARASLVWTPTDPGEWTLRGWLHPVGEFGEPLRFVVE